jgi:hypothetical protein
MCIRPGNSIFSGLPGLHREPEQAGTLQRDCFHPTISVGRQALERPPDLIKPMPSGGGSFRAIQSQPFGQ